MRKFLNDFKGGNVVFSEPTFPFKGFGASQSTLYLTSNFLLKNKINSKISYVKVSDKIFPIDRYN
jgi:sulfide:quinone oxidoreductase